MHYIKSLKQISKRSRCRFVQKNDCEKKVPCFSGLSIEDPTTES